MQLIDSKKLDNLQEVMQEGFYEIILVYIKSSEKILSQMPEAYKNKQFDVLERLAHSLKSSSANIGANSLSDMAIELEQKMKDKDTEDVMEQIANMHKTLHTISRRLASRTDTKAELVCSSYLLITIWIFYVTKC